MDPNNFQHLLWHILSNNTLLDWTRQISGKREAPRESWAVLVGYMTKDWTEICGPTESVSHTCTLI